MHIELTIRTDTRRQDVVITAAARSTVAELAAECVRALGLEPDARLWIGDHLLAPDTALVEAGLRTGSIVSVNTPGERPPGAGILSLQIVGGPNAGTVVPLAPGRMFVGRDDFCDISLADADVSRRHAVIDVSSTGITVHDLSSTNGTRVDGASVPREGLPVRPGELIALGDSLLTVAGPDQAPATLRAGSNGERLLVRSPRTRLGVPGREIAVPTGSTPARPRGVQWAAAVLPAAAGGALAWLAHSPQFLLFALLSPVMMISTALGDRVHWRRSRRRESSAFRRRRAEADRQIREALAAETRTRRAANPDPACVSRIASVPGSRLWERERADPDLLRLRLGTAVLPSTVQTRSGSTLAPAGTLSAVPLCVDLRAGPLGVAGPQRVVAGLARWLVGQLATLHSPADVEIALLLSETVGRWAWARWLPHLRGRVAVGEDCARLVAALSSAIEQRVAARRLDSGRWTGPWLVLVVDRASQLADVPGLTALISRGGAVGLSAICIDAEPAGLPTACAAVARVDGVTGSRLSLRTNSSPQETAGVIDQVSSEWAEALARNLAPIVDASASKSSGVPDSARLIELLDIGDFDPARIAQRWSGSDGGACADIGVCADGPLSVDLVRDGPHALVAGTTGSGKSELLQTLVCGLATNHPPDEVNFLLIDYKGGAAFGDCAKLPHTAGLVTDLDPYLTERALRSLNSELRRRERLFAETGVSDLHGYAARPGPQPIARLIIVVDEFASLAQELPEFVRGLVGVAQRGRSLGVHLVLATQRPGSAVSSDIRANTSLRIALRVTDPSESTDVIDSPVAAGIERWHPGRAYLRTGAALTCFQTSHAGGTCPADRGAVVVERLGDWRCRPTPPAGGSADSDMARLVTAVRAAATRAGRTMARSPWLAPLPDALPRSSLAPPTIPSTVALAHVDLPDEQRRCTLSLDLGAGGSLLASGTTRSGRTGLLVTLAAGAAAQLAPKNLHLHVMDPAGELSATLAPLPQSATVIGPDELDLAPRLLERLERDCLTYAALRASADLPRPDVCTLLLVDGWETVLAALPDLDASRCTEAMANLLRIGPASGVSIAVTGDRSSLVPRFANGFGTRIVMRLADRSDYALAGIAARAVPASMPPGRGLRASDGAVVQIAHAGPTPSAAGIRSAISAIADRWPSSAARPHARTAIKIRPLPTRINLDELPPIPGRLSIGLAGDQLATMSVDPFAGAGRMLVAGPPRSGRTTLLRLLARQAATAGIPTVVAAAPRSPLSTAARELALRVIAPTDAEVGEIPTRPTLLLVDDSEAFLDGGAGDRLTSWIRSQDAPLAAVVAGRADDLATTYRGVGAEVRRNHCGILLRPGPIDGELLGVRLPRRPSSGPPGRGVAVGDPSWGPPFDDGEPVPVQVAMP